MATWPSSPTNESGTPDGRAHVTGSGCPRSASLCCGEVPESFAIAQVAPRALEEASDVGTFAEPTQAQAFMDREFAPRAMGARYDWLYEYDALTVPV